VVEFRILGAVSLRAADGRDLRTVLAQPKRVALLAYLAAATPREFHRRDSLLALFWPELDQEHARAALRQALHGLRRSLGVGTLESRGDEEVRLEERALQCDVLAFSDAVDAGRYADALELYRGDLLDGFFISGAPEFERWLEDERARLRRLAVEAAWALAESCRAARDSTLAAHWARRAAALAHDDEGAVRRLIALLGELGDRAGAVRTYEVFARRLAEEYEVEPAAETRALIAAVRSRESVVPAEASRAPEPADVLQPADVEDPARGVLPLPSRAGLGEGPLSTTRDRRRPVLVTASTLAILALGAAVVWAVASVSRPHQVAAVLDPQRVVVAGFYNRTGDTTLDALAELAGEELTRGLKLIDVVEVADPGATMVDDAGGVSYSTATGREAGAARAVALVTRSGLAVWGSLDRRGEGIEFAAHVVDERNRRVLRALDPVPGNPLEPRRALTVLRDHVMAVVAEAVDPRLGASASAAGDPPLYEAYLAFSSGVGIWYDGRNARDALPHFRHAVALDSTFKLPLIWAAWVHQTLGQCDSTEAIAQRLDGRHLSRLERIQIDRQVARCRGDLSAAYRLAHVLAETRPASEVWQEQLARDALNFDRPREAVEILERLHPDQGALRGRVSYYNWLTNAHHLLGHHDRELAVAKRARSRFPGNLAALRMELLALAALGRGGEVNEHLSEIDALPPDPIRRKATVMREIALDLAVHGDSAAARAAMDRALDWHARQPRSEQATEYLRFERAQTHFAAGHRDSARALAAGLERDHPQTDEYVGLLGVLAAQRGDSVEAGAAGRLLDAVTRPHARGRTTFWRACIAATLGHRDEAVNLLRRARAEGYVFNGLLFLSAHLEPSFATLRGYAPFDELLRPQG
jgi:DNA-binding SARP family transcriptional activator